MGTRNFAMSSTPRPTTPTRERCKVPLLLLGVVWCLVFVCVCLLFDGNAANSSPLLLLLFFSSSPLLLLFFSSSSPPLLLLSSSASGPRPRRVQRDLVLQPGGGVDDVGVVCGSVERLRRGTETTSVLPESPPTTGQRVAVSVAC